MTRSWEGLGNHVTWESSDPLTHLPGSLLVCLSHFVSDSVWERAFRPCCTHTIKHSAFRSDLILLIHPLSQAPASLATRQSAVERTSRESAEGWPVFQCRSLFTGILSRAVSLLQRASRNDFGAEVPTWENAGIEATRRCQKRREGLLSRGWVCTLPPLSAVDTRHLGSRVPSTLRCAGEDDPKRNRAGVRGWRRGQCAVGTNFFFFCSIGGDKFSN